jgi:hypothetical protein
MGEEEKLLRCESCGREIQVERGEQSHPVWQKNGVIRMFCTLPMCDLDARVGRSGRRAGKGVTSGEPKPHIRDITTRRLTPQEHLRGGASRAVSSRWRAIACPNAPPGRPLFTRQLRRRLLRRSASLASFTTMDEGIAPWGEEGLT